jgi:hypothetical protein
MSAQRLDLEEIPLRVGQIAPSHFAAVCQAEADDLAHRTAASSQHFSPGRGDVSHEEGNVPESGPIDSRQ